jgi:catechol-2,3-dioxygenase
MHGIEIVLDRDFGNGNHAIYISDPDGNVVELTERRTDWAGDLVGATPTVKGIAPR